MTLTRTSPPGILGSDSPPPETVEKAKGLTSRLKQVKPFVRLVEQPRSSIADYLRDFSGYQRHQHLECDLADHVPGASFIRKRHSPHLPPTVGNEPCGTPHPAVEVSHRTREPDYSGLGEYSEQQVAI